MHWMRLLWPSFIFIMKCSVQPSNSKRDIVRNKVFKRKGSYEEVNHD
jgi:hypothetical protein